MRKNILHLIFLVFLLVLGVGSNADEPSGPITIVGVDNIAPFSFLLSNGEPSGLYVEFWQLWSSTNNIPIKIELGAFNDGMKKAKKAGSVHAGLFINESRSQWASFSRPIHYVNTGFIYNSSFPENTKLRDLVGVKVGAHRGTFQSEYLINNMPNLDLVLYDDTPDSIDDLLDNKIVALVAEVPFLQSRIERRGLNGVFMFGTEILLGNTVHAAVAKGAARITQ
ncbi:MAG: two-component system sensor histidine kinase/response regulator [Flavobacterium sp.]|jgi:two-component system sensor histidine kinase/response regulator